MGATCVNPNASDAMQIDNMDKIYKERRLPHIDLDQYKTQFERDFFMVLNLLRDNPQSLQNQVKNYVASGKFDGTKNASTKLCNRLQSLPQLSSVLPNKSASNACFVNLTKNESNLNQISGKGVHELRTVDPDLVA